MISAWAAVSAHGQASADDFAHGGQIGLDAVEFLRSAVRRDGIRS